MVNVITRGTFGIGDAVKKSEKVQSCGERKVGNKKFNPFGKIHPRVCLKNRKWTAAGDFGCAQSGPASRWPPQASSHFSDRLQAHGYFI